MDGINKFSIENRLGKLDTLQSGFLEEDQHLVVKSLCGLNSNPRRLAVRDKPIGMGNYGIVWLMELLNETGEKGLLSFVTKVQVASGPESQQDFLDNFLDYLKEVSKYMNGGGYSRNIESGVSFDWWDHSDFDRELRFSSISNYLVQKRVTPCLSVTYAAQLIKNIQPGTRRNRQIAGMLMIEKLGMTLSDWFKSKNFTSVDVFSMYIHIIITITLLQKTLLISHNDLSTKNILILEYTYNCKKEKPIQLEYVFSDGRSICIPTDPLAPLCDERTEQRKGYIPVFIDFGMATTNFNFVPRIKTVHKRRIKENPPHQVEIRYKIPYGLDFEFFSMEEKKEHVRREVFKAAWESNDHPLYWYGLPVWLRDIVFVTTSFDRQISKLFGPSSRLTCWWQNVQQIIKYMGMNDPSPIDCMDSIQYDADQNPTFTSRAFEFLRLITDPGGVCEGGRELIETTLVKNEDVFSVVQMDERNFPDPRTAEYEVENELHKIMWGETLPGPDR